MVKGCEKRVVRLEDHGSRYFEEVLFVLRDGADRTPERDIVAEAGRIIEENTSIREEGRRHTLPSYLFFLLGAACSAALLIPFFFI